jgi:hypothetical protein
MIMSARFRPRFPIEKHEKGWYVMDHPGYGTLHLVQTQFKDWVAVRSDGAAERFRHGNRPQDRIVQTAGTLRELRRLLA